MKFFKIATLGLALASSASLAGDCKAPDAPNIPEGAGATMEQMLAGQKSVKAFQTANLEYMACLEKSFSAAEAAGQKGTDEEKAAAEAEHAAGVDAYNAAVSKEEEVAGEFNSQIKAYKAANPG